jgi:hypothetical protein
MRQMFWSWVARILMTPWVFALLLRLAKRRPFVHIGDYMDRWWLFNPRWRIDWMPAIRIHHIKRPDKDRAKHDHPFDFRSFILHGWYFEEDLMCSSHFHPAGTTYRSAAERFHKITKVSDGGVYTLVICSPKRQSWGFLKYVTMEDAWGQKYLMPSKVHHSLYSEEMVLVEEAAESEQ